MTPCDMTPCDSFGLRQEKLPRTVSVPSTMVIYTKGAVTTVTSQLPEDTDKLRTRNPILRCGLSTPPATRTTPDK